MFRAVARHVEVRDGAQYRKEDFGISYIGLCKKVLRLLRRTVSNWSKLAFWIVSGVFTGVLNLRLR